MKTGYLVLAAAMLVANLAAGMAQAQETVKVAFIAPLTGGSSSIGIGGRNSADLAVQLHNADDDNQYQVEMVTLDDECKPSVGVRVATKAAADPEIVGGITHYCSAVAIATVDVYHRFGLPVMVWGAVLPDITYGNDYEEVFRVNGTMIRQNEAAAEFMTGMGYETWVIIHDTTDYGQGHAEYFTKFLKESGGEVLATFGVTPNQQNFTAILSQTESLSPDVIYFGGLTPVGVRVRSQMERLGLDAQFEGTTGILSEAYIDGLGAELAEGSIGMKGGAPTEKLPGGKFFLKEYQAAAYTAPPDAYGPFAFAAMSLLLDTIEKVGPDREAIIEALSQVDDYESIIGTISFDDHGQNILAVMTKYVVQDGEWVLWEDSEYASGERKLNGL